MSENLSPFYLHQTSTEDFCFRTSYTSTDFSNLCHFHNYMEFLTIIDGSGVILCNGKRHNFYKGNTIIIPQNTPHCILPSGNVMYRSLTVSNVFLERNFIYPFSYTFPTVFTDRQASHLTDLLNSASSDSSSKLLLTNTIKAILDYLLYIYDNFAHLENGKTTVSKNVSRIIETISFIDENSHNKLSLDTIASQSQFSKFHLVHLFKDFTNMTIFEYINAVRCKKALSLLLETKLSIKQISLMCGFESASYFSLIFKQFTNMSPSEIRKIYII